MANNTYTVEIKDENGKVVYTDIFTLVFKGSTAKPEDVKLRGYMGGKANLGDNRYQIGMNVTEIVK